jgi:hypothetical protein
MTGLILIICFMIDRPYFKQLLTLLLLSLTDIYSFNAGVQIVLIHINTSQNIRIRPGDFPSKQ